MGKITKFLRWVNLGLKIVYPSPSIYSSNVLKSQNHWAAKSVSIRIPHSQVHPKKNRWSCLVGGWPTPLKNMSSSVGVTIPNIWKVIKAMFQTTKQQHNDGYPFWSKMVFKPCGLSTCFNQLLIPSGSQTMSNVGRQIPESCAVGPAPGASRIPIETPSADGDGGPIVGR